MSAPESTRPMVLQDLPLCPRLTRTQGASAPPGTGTEYPDSAGYLTVRTV